MRRELSADIECILKRAAVGGYTGNVGKALSTLCGRTGNINCVGLYGLPSMKQIFQDQLINEYNCVLHSMGNPGECNAYEFSDGKIMMVTFNDVNQLNWAQIMDKIGQETLTQEFDAAKLWGIGYWSALPHMSEIFTHLQDEIFPSLSQNTSDKYLVLDLSDLRKRPQESLQDLTLLLPRFENYVHTVLMLNYRELGIMNNALGGDSGTDLSNQLNMFKKRSIYPRFLPIYPRNR